MRPFLAVLATFLLLAALAGAAAGQTLTADDLTVLEQRAPNMMADYLTALVDTQFARRDAVLKKLRSAEDWDRRAEHIRQSMVAWTGPFPPRTPLNARVTGQIDRPDYVMQKVLFESRPGFPVSANLYLPKHREGRLPAVLNVIGHSPAGKATEKVQQRSIGQARKGFVALTIDTIGQGERQVPEYTAYGNPPGNAHQVLGTQAFLAATHVFNLMVWDAIRAVDYLVSRPEVDPDRIGCTGCSGGGMMTTYILPFEPRITVAIPACNPNTWSHRVHAGLATDHEQVFPGAFAAAVDPRGDPLFCQVPKPLLIDATTEDRLNPTEGVWELDGWLKRAYAAHEVSERFKTVMIPGPHGYSLEQREAAYAWLLRWLGDPTVDPTEGEIPVEEEQDTWCTPQGNVYALKHSKQPREFVLEYLETHRPSWPVVSTRRELARHKRRLQREMADVLGLPRQVPVPEATVQASTASDNLRLTPVVLRPEPGIVLPAVWVESDVKSTERGPVIVYLHDDGKTALANEPLVDRLVRSEEFRLLAVDLRGMGETAPGREEKFWDFLAGKPILAQRVADVRSVAAWLSGPRGQAGCVYLWAHGVTALSAAMAAALDDSIAGLVVEEPLLCFESVVTSQVPAYRNEILIAGVLSHFDLTQVYQACCPKPVTLIGPLRGDRTGASAKEVAATYHAVSHTYDRFGSGGNWRVVLDPTEPERTQSILGAFSETKR